MDLDTHSTQIDLPKIWNLAFTYLESAPEIRKSAEETLIQLTQCVALLLLHPPTPLFQTLGGGLTSLAYAPALGNVLRTLEGLIWCCGAAERCGEEVKCAGIFWRCGEEGRRDAREEGVSYREGADAVFSAFARAAGVDGLLSLFPLNLVSEAR